MAETRRHSRPPRTRRRGRRASASRCPTTLFDGTVNMPVMHQAVKAFLANQRQGNAVDEDPRYVDRRQPEAVEAEGHGSRPPGLDARAALGGRRHGVRTDPAQLRAVRAASGSRARSQERVQRARARERDLRDRSRSTTTRRRRGAARASSSASASASRRCSILTDGVKPNVFLSGRNLPTCT